MAIEHAHLIISWQENLGEDEMPPQWMWTLDQQLNEWFEEVDSRRKEKYGGGGGDSDESSPMMQNELARDRKG